jgi:hypothetical protein
LLHFLPSDSLSHPIQSEDGRQREEDLKPAAYRAPPGASPDQISMVTEPGDLFRADLSDDEPTTRGEGRQLQGVPRAGSRRPPASSFDRISQRLQCAEASSGERLSNFFLIKVFALKVIDKKLLLKKTFVFSGIFKTFEKHLKYFFISNFFKTFIQNFFSSFVFKIFCVFILFKCFCNFSQVV